MSLARKTVGQCPNAFESKKMVRIALAYLGIAVMGIFVVTGLPFGIWQGQPDQGTSAGGSDRLSETDPAALDVSKTTGEVSLEVLVSSALAAGQTPAQIDQLINDAVSQGSVRVPAMLVTTEGRVDTKVLLASLAALSEVATKEEGDTAADDSFVTAETAILDIQDMTYLVQTGDSLGSLALKFYGNSELFKPIFEANRTLLLTPTSIRAGQELVIPARSKL